VTTAAPKRSASETRLLELVRTRALRRGDFTLASGKKSDYYLDGKQVTLDGEGALLAAEAILARLQAGEVDAVGGLMIGADPIAGAVAAVSALKGRTVNAFIVRKEVKGHGTGKLVEGPVGKGTRCAVVEDVCSTGSSALKAVDALEAHGCKVVKVITLVDREMGATEAFRARGIAYAPVFTKTEVLAQ
jgi:orotate phosphoribosyltransferase